MAKDSNTKLKEKLKHLEMEFASLQQSLMQKTVDSYSMQVPLDITSCTYLAPSAESVQP
jgi:hypothetical protein